LGKAGNGRIFAGAANSTAQIADLPLSKLSKEQVTKMCEDEMLLSDFYIGLEFWMSGSRWRCTDVGSRVVLAIKLDHDDDPSWYNGPPYAVCEYPIDEDDIPACSLTRHGGNSYAYTDDEIERSRNSGKANIAAYSPPRMSAEERDRFEAESRANLEAMRARWIEEEPMSEKQEAAEWEALSALRAAKAAAKRKDKPPPE
jgi:hypothetical protein